MKTVWKFPIDIQSERQEIMAPAPAEILHAGLDPDGTPCIWVYVDTSLPNTTRTIVVTGTGHLVPAELTPDHHVGSFTHGPFVWHVWAPDVTTFSSPC